MWCISAHNHVPLKACFMHISWMFFACCVNVSMMITRVMMITELYSDGKDIVHQYHMLYPIAISLYNALSYAISYAMSVWCDIACDIAFVNNPDVDHWHRDRASASRVWVGRWQCDVAAISARCKTWNVFTNSSAVFDAVGFRISQQRGWFWAWASGYSLQRHELQDQVSVHNSGPGRVYRLRRLG